MSEPTEDQVSLKSKRPFVRVVLAASMLLGAAMVVCAVYLPLGLGPGVQDFEVVLLGSYTLNRTSAHQVYISANGALDPTIPGIPKKVLECGVHAPFILGKRQALKPRSLSAQDIYEAPDSEVIDYWIVDTRGSGKAFGPLTLDEFNSRRKELAIPDSVTMRDVYTYRNR